eukprot:TRINITY_DN43765_c0_g1_i1.p1 TRINITY_DN43765_c0_g1~~TRINITY_DN43765_c0_g1_i1.p1  ORF type:complete len:391 (+),score=33.60 TRINITY_DN43765_c0_g1_i1:180-1352(+)
MVHLCKGCWKGLLSTHCHACSENEPKARKLARRGVFHQRVAVDTASQTCDSLASTGRDDSQTVHSESITLSTVENSATGRGPFQRHDVLTSAIHVETSFCTKSVSSGEGDEVSVNAVLTQPRQCDLLALSCPDVSRDGCDQVTSEKRKSGKSEQSCLVCDAAENTKLPELAIPVGASCDGRQSVHSDVRSTNAEQEIATRPSLFQNLTRSPPGLTDLPMTVHSIGSAQHATGNCKPCAWFWKVNGCQNGQLCLHCHLCPRGEHRARRKARLVARCTARNATVDGVAKLPVEAGTIGMTNGRSGSSSLSGFDVSGFSSLGLLPLNVRAHGNSSRTSTSTSSAVPLSLFTALGPPLSALTAHDTNTRVPSEHLTGNDLCCGAPRTLRILPLL